MWGIMKPPGGFDARDREPVPSEPLLPTTESPVVEHSDLRQFLTLLRRHAILIAVVTVLTAAATYVVTAREAKEYSAHSTLLYSASSSSEDPTRAVSTIVGISSSSVVLQPVARAFKTTVSDLESGLSITGNPNADLITISVTSGSPSQASKIANDVGSALISYAATGQRNLLKAQIVSLRGPASVARRVRTDPSSISAASQLRTQLAQTKAQLAVGTPSLAVLSPASKPSAPVSPHPMRDALIALFVGLVLGVMLGTLRDRLDRRIRSIEDIEAMYRSPHSASSPSRAAAAPAAAGSSPTSRARGRSPTPTGRSAPTSTCFGSARATTA